VNDKGLTPQRPFVPVPEPALRQIEEQLGSEALSAKAVLVALWRIARREDSASFKRGLSYVATLASVTRRTVERRLPDLERLGLVTVHRGALRCEHTFELPQDATLSRSVATLSRSVATASDPDAVAPLIDVQSFKITLPSTRKARVGTGIDEQALRLYEAYPRKVGRKPALRAISKALKTVGFDALLEAVNRYAQSREGEDPKFTPHPATWFNSERWADEFPSKPAARTQWVDPLPLIN
jgi:hypothetical protein